MEVLRINGGHRFRLKHGPSIELHSLREPANVAFSPRGLGYLQPRVLVKEGEVVALGQPLVEHKKDPRIKFVSPASGLVKELRFGPRRKLEAVVIAIDHRAEQMISAKRIYEKNEINGLTKTSVETLLLEEGLFGYFERFPGSGLAPLSDSTQEIAAIHINLMSADSYWPQSSLAIKDRMEELYCGALALTKIAKKIRIYVKKGEHLSDELKTLAQVVEVENIYPADNLGVQAWYAGTLKKEQCVVGADVELVLDIGFRLLHGKKRVERLYCLAGNAVKNPQHYRGRMGLAIGDLTDGGLRTTDDIRLIAGGLFRGTKVRFQDFLGAKDVSVQAMVEDKARIPFSFFRLGADKLTMARTWLSGFNASLEHEVSTNNNGEERACIQCGYCIDACPVKLMPNLLMKASRTSDIEKLEWLSIHDCADCGLCTFVCPSKIELGHEIELGKKLIEKEG